MTGTPILFFFFPRLCPKLLGKRLSDEDFFSNEMCMSPVSKVNFLFFKADKKNTFPTPLQSETLSHESLGASEPKEYLSQVTRDIK